MIHLLSHKNEVKNESCQCSEFGSTKLKTSKIDIVLSDSIPSRAFAALKASVNKSVIIEDWNFSLSSLVLNSQGNIPSWSLASSVIIHAWSKTSSNHSSSVVKLASGFFTICLTRLSISHSKEALEITAL